MKISSTIFQNLLLLLNQTLVTFVFSINNLYKRNTATVCETIYFQFMLPSCKLWRDVNCPVHLFHEANFPTTCQNLQLYIQSTVKVYAVQASTFIQYRSFNVHFNSTYKPINNDILFYEHIQIDRNRVPNQIVAVSQYMWFTLCVWSNFNSLYAKSCFVSSSWAGIFRCKI
jgi:hypothetical protein